MSRAESEGAGQTVPGTVYLVGAGPGDPGLITVRGSRCLQIADVVIFDYLANPEVLAHASPAAQLVCLGRHGRREKIWSQDEVNEAMIHHASLGKCVVRLKGGDPSIFGRSAEEAAALRAAGIPFELVPGVTAALAAASYAGIPVTHRDHAPAVAFVTGQENPKKSEDLVDFAALAKFPGTLVFYMAVTSAKRWVPGLLTAGKPADTPVALVRRCSLPDQETFACRLDQVIETTDRLRPPLVAIVGATASQACRLYSRQLLPLHGQRVLVTRAQQENDQLGEQLAQLGAAVIYQPAIEVSPLQDRSHALATFARLAEFDWLTFASTNGVRHFFKQFVAAGYDIRLLAGLKIASVGPRTTEVLRDYLLRVDLEAQPHRAEAMAEQIARAGVERGVLEVRANRGRDIFGDLLREQGMRVEKLVAYESADVAAPDPRIVSQLANGDIHWVTMTSSAIARSTIRLFGECLATSRIASISPITSGVVREHGLQVACEAEPHTMGGVAAAILAACEAAS